MIESAATRMGEQLQALLFLAREQALGIMEPVALAECVYDAVEPVCTEIYRKRLNFEVAIEPKAVLTLNPQALHTALVNLLRNAVQIPSAASFASVLIGTVFRSRIQELALSHFTCHFSMSVSSGGTSQGEGLGIGLAIVKRICDHYGWTIDVDSTPGKGTTFISHFPDPFRMEEFHIFLIPSMLYFSTQINYSPESKVCTLMLPVCL